MKINVFILALLSLVVLSCDNDDNTYSQEVTIAIPISKSVAQIRADVGVEPVRQMSESGKIYAYQNFVLINDINKGIHIIDNSNPSQPIKIAFLNIPGNIDMAVKEDILYADSWLDLYVFDFSDPLNITLMNRLEEVLPRRGIDFPWETASEIDYDNFDFEEDIIVDWEFRTETREYNIDDDFVLDAVSQESSTGSGGSLARFNIVGDYLYVVQREALFTFNISALDNPIQAATKFVGWQIETIFSDGLHLYIGSVDGMYIYSLANPADPSFLSNITHILGCDPVVVKGDYAYVTIRGGNFCGQQISQLDVIDISDKAAPFIVTSVQMTEPYGLGVKENRLYVSDGPNGLVVFDITKPEAIAEEITYNSIDILDVIPQEDLLLMVGNNTLYNYEYTGEGIGLIASFSLN